jgi:hypothetical protein
MRQAVPIYTVAAPEYTGEEEPDCPAIGRKLDAVIETRFPGRRLAIRAVGLIDHPGMELDDLVAIVSEFGTDRYDPEREGLYYPDGDAVDVPIWATPCTVADGIDCPHYRGDRRPSGTMMGEVIGDFYGGARSDRGYAVRLDLLLVYDLDQLEVFPPDSNWPLENCGCFTFRAPDRKQEALLGLIRIQR